MEIFLLRSLRFRIELLQIGAREEPPAVQLLWPQPGWTSDPEKEYNNKKEKGLNNAVKTYQGYLTFPERG